MDSILFAENGKYTQTEKRTNSEVDSWHTEWNLIHEFKEDRKLNVKAYYYQSERGLPGAVILYNPVSNERLWDKNAFVQAKYQDKIAEKWSLQVLAKYNYAWNKYQDKGAQYEGEFPQIIIPSMNIMLQELYCIDRFRAFPYHWLKI